MKTEQEIRNRLVSIRKWREDAKKKGDKEAYKKWFVVANYFNWILDAKRSGGEKK